MSKATPEMFLNRVARRLRKGQPPFDPPKVSFEQRGNTYAEIWFPTNGCRWNKQGYCTTCNFGQPTKVAPAQMVEAVRLALDALSESMPETLCVTSFNMLDETEVPANIRREIFGMLGKTSARRILTESHPDSVRGPAVRECVDLLNGRAFGIEMGIESMNDFVRRCCINKNFTRNRIQEVVHTCHDSGATALANVLLGAPFLSHAESVDDTCQSIVLGADMGIDEFVLFPNHVKPYTVVEWLHRHGLYRPPSLWQLVAVLAGIEPELRNRVNLAWVSSKDHPGAGTGLAPSIEGPDPELVVETLLDYDNSRDAGVLQWLFDRAKSMQSTIEHLQTPAELRALPERVVHGYEQIGRAVLGNTWWDSHGTAVTDWTLREWRRWSGKGSPDC